MSGRFVPSKVTALNATEVAKAFRSAFSTVVGSDPSKECLALLVAQSALETGRWRSMYNFSFGNARPGDSEAFTCLPICNEILKGKTHWYRPEGEVASRESQMLIGPLYAVPPGHPMSRFCAFDSAESGAIHHLRLLSKRPRYAKAWQASLAGQPLAFVAALKAAGYFTADEAPYARAVVSLWKEYCAMLDRLTADTEPPPPIEIEDSLHADAMRAVATTDPVEWSREDRREAMKEP